MKRLVLLALRLVFVAASAAVLFSALRSYNGPSDWKTEEVFAFQMMVITFPSCLGVWTVVVCLVWVLRLFGVDGIMLPSRPEMVFVWALFALAGYLQWFVLLPRLIKLKKKRPSALPEVNVR